MNWILVALVLILAGLPPVQAADIEFDNGTVWTNVTILRRAGNDLLVQWSDGEARVSLARVVKINGQPLAAVSSRPASRSAQYPASVPRVPSAGWRLWPVTPWTVDAVLWGGAALVAAWIGSLLLVQRDVSKRFGKSRHWKLWNTVALVTPGLGVLVYWAIFGWRAPSTPSEVGEPRVKPLEGEFVDDQGRPIEAEKSLSEPTGLIVARELLGEALGQRASDLHIEPLETIYRIRLRVDGIMRESRQMEKAAGQRVVGALKALAQIDVAERHKGQDGRFHLRGPQGEVDFRVATTSSLYGEKLVVRVLHRKSGKLSLEELGMPTTLRQELERQAHSRAGMILVVGPTGSGKTTTLYAAIGRLDAARLNIMSIEDPVEYELSGATQILVNARAGVTFESGLRSILRQDPDIIFVGEMLDAETAHTGMRAALTGHLVFSSMHAQTALSALARLADLGTEPYQISTALLAVVAQRLVRVLCPDCREPYAPDAAEQVLVEKTVPPGTMWYRARGCDACGGAGYRGRTGLFEMIVLDEELRQAIGQKQEQTALLAIARKHGYQSYREDGFEKVSRGITTVTELLEAG